MGNFAVSSKTFHDFLHDERGSYTLWSLSWFLLYVVLGGLAVDVTDAYRNQALLQSTADSAALAAIMSVGKSWENPVAQANYYASVNMAEEYNGDVLLDPDITLGNWNFTTRTFTPAGVPINAVHVAARRDSQNDNQVVMSFLRILQGMGLRPSWNIATEAIAVAAVSACHNNGLIAGGRVDTRSSNDYYENICKHGVQGVVVRQGNSYESGVAVSTTCTDCVGPPDNDPSDNVGWDEAWGRGGENDALFPLNALMVDEYVDVMRNLPNMADYQEMIDTYGTNYAGWRYLFRDDGSAPALQTVAQLPGTLEPYTVYIVNCNGQTGIPSTAIRNVGIVFGCRLHVPSNQTVDLADVAIFADFDAPNDGISFAGKGKVGHPNCKWGAVEFYTTGSSIQFAASGDVNNVRLISAWNIEWAAQANGRVGIMAEAVNDIIIRTNSDFGLCENRIVNGPNQFTYRLVL